jgi:hypothetical protein
MRSMDEPEIRILANGIPLANQEGESSVGTLGQLVQLRCINVNNEKNVSAWKFPGFFRSMKRTLAALAVLLLLAAPAAVQAQYSCQTNLDGSVYTYSTNIDGSISFDGYAGPPWDVVIPTNINGQVVTVIADGAFQNCVFLTSVTIPCGIASIGDQAFDDCLILGSVTIPASVTNIGQEAFYYCPNLTSITIPQGVTTIANWAFASTRLTGVFIPDSVTNIGVGAFDANSLRAITVSPQNPSYSSTNGVLFDKNQDTLIEFPGGADGSYVIPNGVTNIEALAFDGCTNLLSVRIPGSVVTMGDNVFRSCVFLTNVTICHGVTTLGDFMFANCSLLTNIRIPSSVTGIGTGAFSSTGLICVAIPGSVTNIGMFAFYSCPSLSCVTVPGSVSNIGDDAFAYCSNLTGVYFTGDAPVTPGANVFYQDTNATAWYLPGTAGWANTFWGFPDDGPPAVLWNPLIQTGGAAFGVQNSQFGFNITNTGNTNLTVVVEVCTDFSAPGPVWFPLQTVTLTNGSSYFSEPLQTNTPGRFYSLGLPCSQCGGTLEGSITPSDAVSAGAAWQADDGPWQPAGAMVELPAGPHTVQFSTIPGWNTPSNQIVTITNGFLSTAMGNYTGQGGTLQVTINPSNAVSAGAAWQADGGAWETNGATTGLSAGPHTLQFSNLAGWNTPSNQIVTMTNGFLTTASGNYTEQNFYPYDYTEDLGAITITGFSGSHRAVSIPSTINGLPVAGIGEYAFTSCSNLVRITIPATVTAFGSYAFSDCASLTGVYFYGSAPDADATVFSGDAQATGYYLPGSRGWDDFSAATGLPTTPWLPQIEAGGTNFGIVSNKFGFNVTWACNQIVGVDVCTNLGGGVWNRLETFTLTNGWTHFSDPLQSNSVLTIYRLSSP